MIVLMRAPARRAAPPRSSTSVVDALERRGGRLAISYSADPNEKMSDRASTTPPSCLLRRHVGRRPDDHAAFGRRPGRRRRFSAVHRLPATAGPSGELRQPEIEHLHVSVRVTITLEGLRSRCTMPAAWAAAGASASWIATSSAPGRSSLWVPTSDPPSGRRPAPWR